MGMGMGIVIVGLCLPLKELPMKPIIETTRLRIRELVPTDVEGMFDLDFNPEVH